MPRRRPLRPEEIDLWQRVARETVPLRPRGPADNPPADTAAARPADPPPPPPAPAPIPQFRLGERAAPSADRHDLALPLSARLAAAPLRMDAKAFARMSRGRLAPEARLDLHGLTLAEAHLELIRFVLASQAAGLRLVLVITGKGRPGRPGTDADPPFQRVGALRHQVPLWLRQPPLATAVLQLAEAHLKHGGAGAFYLYLRRPGRGG